MTSTIHCGLITTFDLRASLVKCCREPRLCRKLTASAVCVHIQVGKINCVICSCTKQRGKSTGRGGKTFIFVQPLNEPQPCQKLHIPRRMSPLPPAAADPALFSLYKLKKSCAMISRAETERWQQFLRGVRNGQKSRPYKISHKIGNPLPVTKGSDSGSLLQKDCNS